MPDQNDDLAAIRDLRTYRDWMARRDGIVLAAKAAGVKPVQIIKESGLAKGTVNKILNGEGEGANMRLGKKLAPWLEAEAMPDETAEYVAANPEEFSAEYSDIAREEMAARRYERAQRVRPSEEREER
jgi:hypothetical protein